MLGSGTATDPYLINNADSLNKIRDNLTAHYKLTNDIDLGGIINWNPLGTFTGSLNGDNKTIYNLL